MTASPRNNEAIFHAARDIPDPERRREYLREACGGDASRIAHVEAMLAAADTPDSLLDRPASSDLVATIYQPTTESPGTVTAGHCVQEAASLSAVLGYRPRADMQNRKAGAA